MDQSAESTIAARLLEMREHLMAVEAFVVKLNNHCGSEGFKK